MQEAQVAAADVFLDKFFEIVGDLAEGLTVEFVEVTTSYEVKVRTQDGILPIEALSEGLTSLLSWVGILLQRLYEVYDAMPGTRGSDKAAYAWF